MAVIAYAFPIVACIILWVEFGIDPGLLWAPHVTILAVCWTLTGSAHWLMYRHRTLSDEYLGGYVSGVFFEEAWTEEVTVTEETRDENGRVHRRTRVEHHHHPPKYYCTTSLGSRFRIDSSFFNSVVKLWEAPHHQDSWYGSDIVGGIRWGCHFLYDEAKDTLNISADTWLPKLVKVTQKHQYVNKIKNSNSIFRFEKIHEWQAVEWGLIDYPEIDGLDAPAILSREFNFSSTAEHKARVFNAAFAPNAEMRLYILLFNSTKHGVDTAERQRAYWCGGNKNELVMCIGVDPDNNVHWAKAFSWADEPELEVSAAEWLLKQGQLNLDAFMGWMLNNYRIWKRKSFADFNYIRVALTTTQLVSLLFVSLALSVGTAYFILTQVLQI